MPIYKGNNKVNLPGISKAYCGNNLVWQKETIEYNKMKYIQVQTIRVDTSGLQYTYDGINWTSWTDGSEIEIKGNSLGSYDGLIITDLTNNKVIGIKNTKTRLNGVDRQIRFSFDSDVKLSGNIMSLSNFSETPGTYNFYNLFSLNSKIKNIDNLLLPATEIRDGSYASMFEGCTGLTSIPENLLPSLTMHQQCYGSMFKGCTGLTSIPENLLPATILDYNCYSDMFEGCTGLTSLPEGLLLATTLAPRCYQSMFYGCTGLNISESSGNRLILDLSSFTSLPSGATNSMFTNTGGSFTGAPTAGNKYYSN